jgi:hypothetical protein
MRSNLKPAQLLLSILTAVALASCSSSRASEPSGKSEDPAPTEQLTDEQAGDASAAIVLPTCNAYEGGVSLETILSAAEQANLPTRGDELRAIVLDVCPVLGQVCEFKTKGYSAAQIAGESGQNYDSVKQLYDICGGGSGSSDQAYCDKVKDSRVD